MADAQVTLAIVAKNLTAAELNAVKSGLADLKIITSEVSVPLTKTGDNAKNLFAHMESGQGSVRRLTSAIAFMAVQSTGMNAEVARLTEGLLLFGGGHGAVLVAALAVAAIGGIVALTTGQFDEHKKAIAELNKEYDKLVVAAQKARDPFNDAEKLAREVADAEAALATARAHLTDVTTDDIDVGTQRVLSEKGITHATDEVAAAEARLQQALSALEKPGRDEVDRLTEEGVALTRSKDAMVLYRLQIEKIPQDIRDNIALLLDWLDGQKRQRAAALDAAQATAAEATARFGDKEAADAAQVALVRLKAAQEGDSEATIRQKGNLEQLRLERERYIKILKAQADAEKERTEGTGAKGISLEEPGASATTFVSTEMLMAAGGHDVAGALTEMINKAREAQDPLARLEREFGGNLQKLEKLQELMKHMTFEEAVKALEAVSLKAEVIQGVTSMLGGAFSAMFQAIASGAKFSSRDFIKELAKQAGAQAGYETAAGFAALGSGLLGNPNGFASAAAHFEAAAIFGVVAGGLAAAGGGGGGGGGGGSQFGSFANLSEQLKASQGDATIVIGGKQMSTDPDFLSELAHALDQVGSRRVIFQVV